jgi:hypothetical protein
VHLVEVGAFSADEDGDEDDHEDEDGAPGSIRSDPQPRRPDASIAMITTPSATR